MPAKKDKPSDVFDGTLPTLEEFETEQFFQEISPNVSVIHFHRMYPDGRRPQIGKATLDVIREDVFDYIRNTYVPKYGGGKYMLIARGEASRFLGARTIEVEGDLANAKPANAPANSSTMGTENLSFQDRLMLFSMFKPQQQQFDIGAMFAGMAAMMSAVRPVEQAKQADPIQMFQTIMTMYQTVKDKNEKSPLEQLREVAGVIKEFSSDGKGVDSPWGMIAEVGKDVVDKLGPMMTGVLGPKMPGNPGATPALRPAAITGQASSLPVQPTNGAASRPEASAEDNLRGWLISQIAFFKQKALSGKDPGFWIDYVFENADEPGCQALLYALRRGATFEQLLTFDQEIGQNPQLTIWFREVFDGVKSGLQSDVDSRGEGGNAGHVVPNGGTSPQGFTGTGSSAASAPVSEPDSH